MPYKSEEARRQAARLSMKKKREGLTSGVNNGGVNNTSLTGVNIDAGQQLHPGAAPGAKILSDGQLWYPGNKGYHPIECRCDAHPDRTAWIGSDYSSMIHII